MIAFYMGELALQPLHDSVTDPSRINNCLIIANNIDNPFQRLFPRKLKPVKETDPLAIIKTDDDSPVHTLCEVDSVYHRSCC